MATKQEALRVATKFGFTLDESVSGKTGIWFAVTFDHPGSYLGYECRSIHCEGTSASEIWQEAIDRMKEEGPLRKPCTDPFCEYHA